MSERTPAVEDIRQALRMDGWTLDEADEGIERIKLRGIGVGQEMAREAVREATGDAVRKLQAIAWDEGYEAGQDDELGHQRGVTLEDLNQYTPNPYREGESDE